MGDWLNSHVYRPSTDSTNSILGSVTAPNSLQLHVPPQPSGDEEFGIPDGPVHLRVYYAFMLIQEPLKRLLIYKKPAQQLLDLCKLYAQRSLDYSGGDWYTHRTLSPPLLLAFKWYLEFFKFLREWTSDSCGVFRLLVNRKYVKNGLDKLLRTMPRHVLNQAEEQGTGGPSSDHFARQLLYVDSEDTVEALQLVLSSKEELKSAMRLRGEDALSFLDLLDQTMDNTDPDRKLHGQCLHALRKLCGRSSKLPTSCLLAQGLRKESDEPLASGGFADVWLGMHEERPVALKVLRIYGRTNLEKVKKSFCREAVLWKRVAHAHIVPFLGVSTTLFPLCMVSEWMENGNIVSYLKTNSRANRLELVTDIATGLRYLHSIGVLHGDLKGANILIDNTLHARLSDFGLTAVTFDPNTVNAITTSSAADGSIRWMAPEFISPESAGRAHAQPSPESDIYALAMVIWEIFTGRVPFHEHPIDATVVFMIIMGVRPLRPLHAEALGLSDALWNMMEMCWSADWRTRPRVPAVLQCIEEARASYKPPSWEAEWAPALQELQDGGSEGREGAEEADSSDDDDDVVGAFKQDFTIPRAEGALPRDGFFVFPPEPTTAVAPDALTVGMRRLDINGDTSLELTPRPPTAAPAAAWADISKDEAWY